MTSSVQYQISLVFVYASLLLNFEGLAYDGSAHTGVLAGMHEETIGAVIGESPWKSQHLDGNGRSVATVEHSLDQWAIRFTRSPFICSVLGARRLIRRLFVSDLA